MKSTTAPPASRSPAMCRGAEPSARSACLRTSGEPSPRIHGRSARTCRSASALPISCRKNFSSRPTRHAAPARTRNPPFPGRSASGSTLRSASIPSSLSRRGRCSRCLTRRASISRSTRESATGGRRARRGVLIVLLLFAGCLVSEVEQYTLVINKDGKTGTLTLVRRNMQSDAEDTSQQRKDFEELLDNRTSDTYLLNQLEQGFYVKQRALTSEKGVLIWKEKLLVADVTKLLPGYEPGRPIRLPTHDTPGLSTRTNGRRSMQNDSRAVEWPANTVRLELTSSKHPFSPSSDFSARYQAYRKKHR